MVDADSKTVGKNKITSKSTRQEILDAYSALLAELEGQPTPSVTAERSLTQETVRTLTDVKLTLSSQLDKLVEQLLKKLADLQELTKQLEQERQRLLDEHRMHKQRLDLARKEAELQFAETQRHSSEQLKQSQLQQEALRIRDEEEYQYQLSLKHRYEEDEYRTKCTAREAALTERETILKNREAEIKQMTVDLAVVPKQVEDAVTTATDSLRSELTGAHQQQMREIQLTHAHSDEMAKLRITSLEQTIKLQSAEIEHLKRQLVDATRQLKEVAVSVIASRAPQTTPEEAK